ncbi:DNA endonuclease RBBP8 [Oncorhynchus tshawytscha]|uniref:DNA endonuclease Ctp1 N-terminal domain-containing protein n=1 Tax=Oncorhynchus tshawytscha TaxID=74940 RepID=A0A8C8D8A6_ONCTS|nr:DNA endonuclease RBBP8 [Oncorhynchus tshawytscha]
MALEGFNKLFHKLREAHEREVKEWQETFQELNNKNSCETKQMEELFNKNQQLKEHQRLLTENIKQLENRLRAGLCDRCTVTQDVAKRRQQEYETSQIQSLHHISILVGKMNKMKTENQRLQEEVSHLRGAQESQGGHSSSQDATPEVRQSADISPSAVPHATAIRSLSQPPEGATAGLSIVNTEMGHRRSFVADETLLERRHVKGWHGKQSYKSHKPLFMSTPIPQALRPEQSTARGNTGEKRVHSMETIGQQRYPVTPSIPPHLFVLKNTPLPSSPSLSSSSLRGDEKQKCDLVHAPVPYRPFPIKSTHLSVPWPLPEHSDWGTLATSVGDGLVVHPNPNPNLQTFHQQSSSNNQSRGQSTGQAWPKPGKSPAARVQDQDRRGVQHPCRDVLVQPERVFGEGLKGADSPLDLSDPGRFKSSKSPQDSKASPTLQDVYIEGETSNRATRTDSSPQIQASPPSSSSFPPAPPSSSSSTPPSSQQRQSPSDHNLKEGGQSEMVEADGKADKRTGKESKDRKDPVLTISLHPVVLLEALNYGLQNKLYSNGKSAQSTAAGSNSDDQEVESSLSGSESSQSSKRKWTRLDTDTEAPRQKEKRINLLSTVTGEEPTEVKQMTGQG